MSVLSGPTDLGRNYYTSRRTTSPSAPSFPATFCFFVWISYIRQRHNNNDIYSGSVHSLIYRSITTPISTFWTYSLLRPSPSPSPRRSIKSTSTSISTSEPKSIKFNIVTQQCFFDYFLHLLQSSCPLLPSSSPFLLPPRPTREYPGHHLRRAPDHSLTLTHLVSFSTDPRAYRFLPFS